MACFSSWALASLNRGLSPVSWNKAVPPQITFGHVFIPAIENKLGHAESQRDVDCIKRCCEGNHQRLIADFTLETMQAIFKVLKSKLPVSLCAFPCYLDAGFAELQLAVWRLVCPSQDQTIPWLWFWKQGVQGRRACEAPHGEAHYRLLVLSVDGGVYKKQLCPRRGM